MLTAEPPDQLERETHLLERERQRKFRSMGNRVSFRQLRTSRRKVLGSFVPRSDICSAAKLHHSITSSARPSKVVGKSSPSALAVLRLITSSYLVGACTGRSAGFSPLRMRS